MQTTALHRKLKSKVEALRILRQELELFRRERDQFKLMAETLQLRYSTVKRSSLGSSLEMMGAGGSVASLMHQTRERNLKLTTEVEALKQKLSELQGDIEILRKKPGIKVMANKSGQPKQSMTADSAEQALLQCKEEKANFIWLLENLKKKVNCFLQLS